MNSNVSSALDIYREALDGLIVSNCIAEIEWQRSRVLRDFNEEEFLCEAAWVVLNSGFKESVVRSKFDYISLCFLDWCSAKEITEARDQCISSALLEFGHLGKISAIARVAEIVAERGFSDFKKAVLGDPIAELKKLPHVGPITVWHLAKNLGFNVAKPDRHLVRLASEHGYQCVHAFCETIAHHTGEKVAVVDLVLWRYMVDRPR